MDVMTDLDETPISPDEAGAFVAQWAQHNKVGISELTTRLGVSEEQAGSLLRQAKGRLSMEKWLAEKQPRPIGLSSQWATSLAIFAIGCAVGCVLTSYFLPGAASPPPSAQLNTAEQYQVTFSNPTSPASSDVTGPAGQGNATSKKGKLHAMALPSPAPAQPSK